ncbi:hypothetical protein JAAARDRAFT_41246 [Jaapia argillacea MUCL 33604]|uniref:PH domain-containing protein n=1 Tax=Jaapia argillacea MUCL 33604 TaxID=933084 RepID=A0A067PLQ6_9AGAM|nr:hypothetical protein JAAARDRAFT_41246 [Jaapia argillacea MUCL 33604]
MSSSSRTSLRGVDTSVIEPLYQVKLLAALRSGDPALIHPFLAEISKDRRKSEEGEVDVGGAALHLAIRCASCDTVSLLLSHRSISPNAIHPPGSGTTALHLAASISRADVVKLLLDQDGIDDTLRDKNGKTCLDVAKGKDVVRAIEDSRQFLTASYRSLLRAYTHSPAASPPPPALLSLLSSPRVKLIDLSYFDDDTSATLLHEAAKRRDLRLIELGVRAGGDVFVRDGKGRGLGHGLGKDDKVRVFLRQFANRDPTLIETPSDTEPPTQKGYLNKYTNVAKGYNTRWFVLKDGVLSYYRYQGDESIASRGSIALTSASLKIAPGGEKLRFEVHSTPSKGHQTSGQQKWYLRANHPVEAARWVKNIERGIEWAKKGCVEGGEGTLKTAPVDLRRSGETDGVALSLSGSVSGRGGIGSSSVRSGFSGTGTLIGTIGTTRTKKRQGSTQESTSAASSIVEESSIRGPSPNGNGNVSGGEVTNGEGDEEVAADDSSASESLRKGPPYDGTFELHANSIAAQMDLTSQLLSSLSSRSSTGGASTYELQKGFKDSFNLLQTMITDYMAMTSSREHYFKTKLATERERQSVWEESLKSVVREGEVLERELRNRSRRKSRMVSDREATMLGDELGMIGGTGTVRRRPPSMSFAASPPPMTLLPPDLGSPKPLPSIPSPSVPGATPGIEQPQPKVPSPITPSVALPTPRQHVIPTISSPGPTPITAATHMDDESAVDTDEEDEFFDAIEANALPNLLVPGPLLPSHPHPELTALSPLVNVEQYAGYSDLRTHLKLDADNRPTTSLWAVLKHSIGKDLTRISFPVFFNEPTSMLQRMAEDMEFSECLDVAASEEDPQRRIAFVAAFAMSNYSSTIGRIAKPFNPMLGETFEYVRLDKEYRYVSEQVSHHPPISACWAESPSWNYFGEVDAKNKFMGKSFEIRPTGVAHADLIIPEEWGPDYPKATGSAIRKGKVVEHYSWKKVTTSVSGFILGSPTIDHYGDMRIVNHRTRDECILTFKPRGWRGKDAYEISGYVMDAEGTVTYEIAGRWNSQLVARRVGTGIGSLHPDVSVDDPEPTYSPEYILLWRNSQKPTAPFNLTPYAITLNDCPDNLRPYLSPTDCRLRPDQRAFELGNYELANDLKNKQEEFQRATRKAREEGRLPRHRPRWFQAETDGDTGERVWTPLKVGELVEYWVRREEVWKAKGDARWKDVEPIFIEDKPY